METKKAARLHCSNCGDRLPADPLEAHEAFEAIANGASVQCPKCFKVERLIEELLRQQGKSATAGTF